MVDLLNTMVDFPNTMVDLPNTMVDLPNTIIDLPSTMVSFPNTMVDQKNMFSPKKKKNHQKKCFHQTTYFYSPRSLALVALALLSVSQHAGASQTWSLSSLPAALPNPYSLPPP